MAVSNKILDKELESLRKKIKRRDAKIRTLKKELEDHKKYINSLGVALNKPHLIVENSAEEQSLVMIDDEEEINQYISEIFGDTIFCTACGCDDVLAFSFCPGCQQGWAYCNKCGDLNRAKKENNDHMVPTHGLFLDMFIVNEIRNSNGKPN